MISEVSYVPSVWHQIPIAATGCWVLGGGGVGAPLGQYIL
jgi:hypothetical protein